MVVDRNVSPNIDNCNTYADSITDILNLIWRYGDRNVSPNIIKLMTKFND